MSSSDEYLRHRGEEPASMDRWIAVLLAIVVTAVILAVVAFFLGVVGHGLWYILWAGWESAS